MKLLTKAAVVPLQTKCYSIYPPAQDETIVDFHKNGPQVFSHTAVEAREH